MPIAKLSFVNIIGDMNSLDNVILNCLDRGDFHPERSIDYSGNIRGFSQLTGENPYAELFARLTDLGRRAGLDPAGYMNQQNESARDNNSRFKMQRCLDFYNSFHEEFTHLQEHTNYLRGEIQQDENALAQLLHIHEMDFDFDSLFTCRYVKVRIGRMPIESMQKLTYYRDRNFLFIPFDREKDFNWGIYFALSDYIAEIDDIFSSLYFERIRVPDFVHGRPEEALGKIRMNLETNRAKLEVVSKQVKALVESNRKSFYEIYSRVLFLSESYEMRSYVAVLRRNFLNLFHITGFIEECNAESFAKQIGEIANVTVEVMPAGSDQRIKDPTKLQNNWFCKPFEMFVDMYGLPSYGDIDPTPYVAITYCLLFGIMFGDLGQGLLLVLIGSLIWKLKKLNIGRVINRVGIFSSVFGLLYGSVFGFEHLIDPLFHMIGLQEKPIEVMAPEMTNVILIGAVGLGVLLILISMLFNIVVGLRKHDPERAFFSANGVAGLVFYGSVLTGAVAIFITGVNLFNPFYVLLLILLPLAVILLKEPLGEMAHGKSFAQAKPQDGMGSYLMVGVFELFEVLLSFFSNTMSFLRVGGFVLSHAGMMAVVMTLSEMVGGAGSPVVLVIGNLFVMALEGLIVGIQVLRLEFYELFSRYFDGDGKPFLPVAFTGRKSTIEN